MVFVNIQLPFTSKLNPHLEAVYAEHSHWLSQSPHSSKNQWSFYQRLHLPQLLARVYPHACSERLRLILDWGGWLFFQDQWFRSLAGQPELVASLANDLINVFNGATPLYPQKPLVVMFADWSQRMAGLTSNQWRERFGQMLSTYLHDWVYDVYCNAYQPTINNQLAVELHQRIGAATSSLDFVDFAQAELLPPSVKQDPTFQSLGEITNNVVCWMHDIASLERDLTVAEPQNIAVLVKQREHCSWSRAIERVEQMCYGEVAAFERIVAERPHYGEFELVVSDYIENLRAWMQGTIDWLRLDLVVASEPANRLLAA